MLGEGIAPSAGTCRPLVTNLVRGMLLYVFYCNMLFLVYFFKDKKRDMARRVLRACKEKGLDVAVFEKTVER